MRTLWIVAVLLMGVEGSLLQFGAMIIEETLRNPVTSYSAYGCYCGVGGRRQPMDATDRCCFVHDCCYGRVNDCNPKTLHYIYGRRNNVIVCRWGNECQKAVCECDKAAAICFRRNLKSYKIGLQFYVDAFCRGKSPKCPEGQEKPLKITQS
uniref:PLA2(IIA)-Aze2 n=1 Tax=Azemiops feae TaxID=8773 RepID=A7X4P4_AZEFE|nr:PLA2(IIA)-Aze2 [Azemiops feae]